MSWSRYRYGVDQSLSTWVVRMPAATRRFDAISEIESAVAIGRIDLRLRASIYSLTSAPLVDLIG